MTAFATIGTAVQAMRLGAFDYVQKPFESDEILVVVDRAIEHQKLVAENQAFRANAEAAPPKVLVGDSRVMGDIKEGIVPVVAAFRHRHGSAAKAAPARKTLLRSSIRKVLAVPAAVR